MSHIITIIRINDTFQLPKWHHVAWKYMKTVFQSIDDDEAKWTLKRIAIKSNMKAISDCIIEI